jgi:hypothetical protein
LDWVPAFAGTTGLRGKPPLIVMPAQAGIQSDQFAAKPQRKYDLSRIRDI